MVQAGIYQDVLGQWPQLKTYNHGAALYKIDESVRQEDIIAALQRATSTLAEKIPWLVERVTHSDLGPGRTGRYQTAPWPGDHPPNRLLRVKDCTQLLPSYDELYAKQMPVQLLDSAVICPVPGFPTTYDEDKIGPAPACLIQINFIQGGAILVFSNQHNVMDGTGIFQVVALLALLLNGEEIPQEAIDQGNRDRATVVPLYEPGRAIKDHSFLRAATPIPAGQPPLAPAKWLSIRFFKEMLPKVKALATKEPTGQQPALRISTGDAVSALYWKCLANARTTNGLDPASRSKFSRTIDARRAVGVPTSYMGQMVYSSATYLTYRELLDLPLSAIAFKLRENLNEANTEYAIRSYATFLAQEPDKTKLAYTGPFDRATDISSSSMAQAALVLNFGPLGQPKFIRRPNFAPIPGTLYFYPPEASGDLNLLVCWNDYELEAMNADPLWRQCTEVIG